MIIAKTKSVCPICLSTLKSYIVRKKSKIFLCKVCPMHGNFEVLLSNNPDYYVPLRKYYFQTMYHRIPQTRYLLLLTSLCNLYCPICALGKENSNNLDLSLDDIQKLIKDKKGAKFVIFGAEPTCREDLIDVIKIFKKSQKVVYLYTNGQRLNNRHYLESLKNSGVDKIYFQFDGFNESVYEFLRGAKLLNSKLNVLKNLKESDIPIVLNATIARNINENEMIKIFQYGLKNGFVRAINFTTYERSGWGKDYYPEGFIMPDELVDIFVQQNNGKITRKAIFLFQKFLYAYLSFLNRRSCFYIQYFWVVRTKDSYYTIDEVLNLEKMEKSLDRYKNIYRKNKTLAKCYFLLSLYKLILKPKSFIVLKDLILMAISYALGSKEYAKISKRFLQIIFSTGCDSYKIDYQVIRNCNNGVVYKNKKGEIKIVDSDGFYLVNSEKQALRYKNLG